MRRIPMVLALALLGSLALAAPGEITAPMTSSLSTADGSKTGTISQTDFDSFSAKTARGLQQLKGRYASTDTTMSLSEAVLWCDSSGGGFTCGGSASNACSTYTDSGTCGSHSEYGCGWTPHACSDFPDSGSCTPSGCNWTNASPSCSGLAEVTCVGLSGSGCTPNYSNCSFSDQASCQATGCAWNSSDCGGISDQASCMLQTGCSWDGASCSGQYNTSCTGSPYLSCSGNYDSFSCTGTYGTCAGGACSNITSSSANCTSEGCTASARTRVTLPAISSAVLGDGVTGYVLRVVKVNPEAGACVAIPAGGNTIEGDPSRTLSSQWGGGMTLHPYIHGGVSQWVSW